MKERQKDLEVRNDGTARMTRDRRGGNKEREGVGGRKTENGDVMGKEGMEMKVKSQAGVARLYGRGPRLFPAASLVDYRGR